MGHPEHHGFTALCAPSVAAQVDGRRLYDGGVEAAWAEILHGTRCAHGGTAAQQYADLHQRSLHAVPDVLLLGLRQLGTQVRNDAVVAGQDAMLAAHRVGLATFHMRAPRRGLT